MTRLDRFISRRLIFTIAGVVFVFFGLIALGESLDSWRLSELAKTRGQEIAALSVVANSARWSIRALPVTFLIGAIIALINLNRHRELVVMGASGLSVWRILRGPVLAVLAVGFLISLVVDSEVTRLSRFIEPAPQVAGTSLGANNEIWFEQRAGEARFIVRADRALPGGTSLADVVVFLGQDFDLRRITAKRAELRTGLWVFTDARIFSSNGVGQKLESYFLETNATIADLRLRLTSSNDLTIFELADALATGLTDANIAAAAATRFSRLLALPVLLVGTLLIAFAFTGGYRRTSSYGGTILYGIVLGFVMFVVNEMAEQAGSAGVLAPTVAAWGPAIVTVVVGLTVLLYREDGRA